MAPREMHNGWKKLVSLVLFGLFLIIPGQVMADDQTTPSAKTEVTTETTQQYEQVITLLEEQNKKNSREFRQLKREVAALSQKMESPGISEILGGIGYIFGLFGVAAYFMSRKKDVPGGQ